MKNAKSFYKKLKKLIEEEKPDSCEVVFSVAQAQLYVIKSDAEFVDKNRTSQGTSWHGVLTPTNVPDYDEGYPTSSIIGDAINVDMAAVQE